MKRLRRILVLRRGRIAFLAVVTLLAACGNDSNEPLADADKQPKLTAVLLGEQEILDSAKYLQQQPYIEADHENGRRQAVVCMACHSLHADGPKMIGPALHGMFGRRAGQVDGFAYSPVLRESDFTWTPRALDAWLAEPAMFLPGNRMMFVGVPEAQNRRDLIAFLLANTGADENDKN